MASASAPASRSLPCLSSCPDSECKPHKAFLPQLAWVVMFRCSSSGPKESAFYCHYKMLIKASRGGKGVVSACVTNRSQCWRLKQTMLTVSDHGLLSCLSHTVQALLPRDGPVHSAMLPLSYVSILICFYF